MDRIGVAITALAMLGVALAVVEAYLKVNKLWARRHVREVAESISIAAALLSLLTTLPFLVKFVVVDRDWVAAAKFLVSLLVFLAFFLVGIGYWVRRHERPGIWRLTMRALAIERGELGYLVRSFTKPREAPAIVRILRLISLVDRNLDPREAELLASVAGPWGIHPEELRATRERDEADITEVRQAFDEYLAMRPPPAQVEKVHDLVRFMVHADREVSEQEALVLAEIGGAVAAYLSEDDVAPTVYEVLLVPQRSEQIGPMQDQLTDRRLRRRAGGEAFVTGSYYSEAFARAICLRYRAKGFFSTVERVEAGNEHSGIAPD